MLFRNNYKVENLDNCITPKIPKHSTDLVYFVEMFTVDYTGVLYLNGRYREPYHLILTELCCYPKTLKLVPN